MANGRLDIFLGSYVKTANITHSVIKNIIMTRVGTHEDHVTDDTIR